MNHEPHPALPLLEILKADLEALQEVLLSLYPPLGCAPSRNPHSEEEAYANGVFYQLDTLAAFLGDYTESIARAQGRTATNPRTNLGRCFRCQRNFNPIDLVMVVKRYTFLQAVDTRHRLIRNFRRR